ncbi:MAG: response regulator [Paenibacillus sp.]|nr:response regulator [Paenibacillus sp.]
MLKLLIAEDELSFREGIIQRIDWPFYDIEIVGAAMDGREAINLMRENKPDVLLTDIRMPFMNGLELIQTAQDEGLSFYSIILTGHSDFNYARDAVRYGASEYLLKPCLPEDILEAILTVKEKIDKDQKNGSALQQLNQNWTKNIPLLKNQILNQWLSNPPLPLEDREQIIEEMGISLKHSKVHVGCLRIDTPDRREESKLYKRDIALIRYAAINILTETLLPLFHGFIEPIRYGEEILWLANIPDKETDTSLKKKMEELQRNMETFLKISITISISSVKPSLDEVHTAYLEALEAMAGRFYQGKGGVFLYSEHNQRCMVHTSILENEELHQLELEIKSHLENHNYEQALDHMDHWLDYIRCTSQYEKNEVHLRATIFILELQKFSQERKSSAFEWKDDLINWVERVPSIETLEELATIMQKIIQSIVEIDSQQKPLHRTVQAALEWIIHKYNTSISLESVAKETYVSNTYLSSLFKQELGINFLDYLHQFRVEKAKELLKQNYKIYAVAKLVGYQEERHFRTTFKKWTGLTPTQYQKNV